MNAFMNGINNSIDELTVRTIHGVAAVIVGTRKVNDLAERYVVPVLAWAVSIAILMARLGYVLLKSWADEQVRQALEPVTVDVEVEADTTADVPCERPTQDDIEWAREVFTAMLPAARDEAHAYVQPTCEPVDEQAWTIRELKALAKGNVKGYGKMRKHELIDALQA